MLSEFASKIKGSSHGAIATVIFLSRYMGCTGFNIGVHMVQLRQLHYIPKSRLVVRNKSLSQSQSCEQPLNHVTVDLRVEVMICHLPHFAILIIQSGSKTI